MKLLPWCGAGPFAQQVRARKQMVPAAAAVGPASC